MAKKNDYAQYTCDRCGKQEYLPEGASTVNRWYPMSRITADGITMNYLFDNDCYADYQQLVASQDAAFNTFMKNIDTEEAGK